MTYEIISTIRINGAARSRVYLVARADGSLWVRKEAPKYNIDNEVYALEALKDTPYVPRYERGGLEVLYTEYVDGKITHPAEFLAHLHTVLETLEKAGLRHGDLTEYSVRVRDNMPVLIDWAESRSWDDPRPDKRREGDAYWLAKTMTDMAAKA